MASLQDILGPGGKLSRIIPHFEFRRAQVAMAKAIREALLAEQHILVEAGTGTGKTLSYLLPVVLHGRKALVSTGTKALQDQLLHKDLPLLKQLVGQDLKTAVIKGRNNYLCLYRYRNFQLQQSFLSPADIPLFAAIESWAETTQTGDRAEIPGLPDNYPTWRELSAGSENCLGSKCSFHDDCFSYKARIRARRADLVVCNHYLFFADLAVRREADGAASVLPDVDVVVLDEAHLLDEIATRHLGTALSPFHFQDLLQDIRKEQGKLNIPGKRLVPLCEALRSHFRQLFQHFGGNFEQRRLGPRDRTATLDRDVQEVLGALQGVRAALEEIKESEEKPLLQERCHALAYRLEAVTAFDDDEQVYFTESLKRAVQLNACPIDVSRAFREEVLGSYASVVLTSATLTAEGSFTYLKQRLGVDQARELVLESPFDFRNQALLYLPGSMAEPNDPKFPEAVAEQVQRIVRLTRGRALVLFTSYRNMERVYELLENKLPYPLLLQGDQPKGALLEEFQEKVSSVLLATASFWQGVDVPGEALSAVIIDKLPFASPGDPLISARIDALRKQGGNPFFELQVPMAILTLKQGVGRLIRRGSDKGVLALLDVRLTTKRYGMQFLQSLPPCRRLTTPDELDRETRALLG
jgi:ATP-dependent DNA helicase DinG